MPRVGRTDDGGEMKTHVLKVCVFCEIQRKFCIRDTIYNVDEICDQLYMDRLGHGINGTAVTRR